MSPKLRLVSATCHFLPNIRETLASYRATEPKYADDLLFHSNVGNPVYPRSLLTTFNWLTEQAGLLKICLHEIRHTVATLLKDSGVTPKDAQVILGHSDISTTLQTYIHSNSASKIEAMNALAVNLNN